MSEEQEQERKWVVSPGPHIKGPKSIDKVMMLVIIALLPATAAGVYYFGAYVLFVLGVSILTALVTEMLIKRLRKRPFHMDGSAILTGLLLALILPPRIPLWTVVIGSAFAIAIAKEAFGGLGHNIFNPALAGRAFLATSFTGLMTRWVMPVDSMTADAVTCATPLSESFAGEINSELYREMLLGNIGGSIGETSALLLIAGGLFLVAIKIVNWRIPFIYIGTVFLLAFAIGEDPVFHILAGGLMLGAFFMATDYVTAPLTNTGKAVFAAGCGVLTVSIRLYGGMPEGVAFSILIMNAFTPLIDGHFIPTPLGYKKPEKEDKKEEKKPEPKKEEEKKEDKKPEPKKEDKKPEPKEEEKNPEEKKEDKKGEDNIEANKPEKEEPEQKESIKEGSK